MGVYIKMEMPQTCFKCKLSRISPSMYAFCPLNEKCYIAYEAPPSDCPLVPVPPHGRLGDLDKLENCLRHMAKYQYGERQQGILGCCETIRLAPIIIPADDKDINVPTKEEGE